MQVNNVGLRPIKSKDRDRATLEHYWMCPKCQTRVGGYAITGRGEDDWVYDQDKFCKECGTKIDWSKNN